MRTLADLSWFWARVQRGGEDACWLWTGTVEVLGYGVAWVEGRTRKAHVIAWESINGPKPEGLTLDHLCRVRNCVRLDHLDLVPHRINVLRGVGPTAVNAVKTQCDNGHELNAENTYLRPNGAGRDCRACRRDRQNAYYKRRRLVA